MMSKNTFVTTTIKIGLLALLLVMQIVWFATDVSAHGIEIDMSEVGAIEIHARYDTGEPMVNAQVSIYAPSDKAMPWQLGEADADGYFVFVPDREIAGTWDVQVRTAGHGDWVYIDVAEGSVTGLTGSSGGLTVAQIVMMSAAIIWGFIGTALYFMCPKTEKKVHEEQPAMAA